MISYPNGKKIYKKPLISSGNRGMDFEDAINLTNDYYRENNIALIYKKPTPIKLVKMDYEKGKIVEAYFQQPSTTDYNGVYKGYYIDFEAKETNNATSFPLANIHAHQVEHLKKVLDHKGIAFIIVSFRKKEEVFILPANIVIQFYEAGARKSIPYQTFLEQGYRVKEGYAIRLDYLKVIDEKFIKTFD